MSAPTVGVLGLQGDVREHLRMLADSGAEPTVVRRPDELARVDGLILPGGESTTMIKLAATFEMLEPLRARVASGLPVFGTCAGMILLADHLIDGAPGQQTIGGLDITVRRNAFGRQVDSFEADLVFEGVAEAADPFHAMFIRAPWVEKTGADVDVLAQIPVRDSFGQRTEPEAVGRIVAVRSGPLLATSFHPEVTGDPRLHGLFVRMVEDARRTVD